MIFYHENYQNLQVKWKLKQLMFNKIEDFLLFFKNKIFD